MYIKEIREKIDAIPEATFIRWEAETKNIKEDYRLFFTDLIVTYISKIQQDQRPESILGNFLIMLWLLETVGIIEIKHDIYSK
jgi:hypothetical protein